MKTAMCKIAMLILASLFLLISSLFTSCKKKEAQLKKTDKMHTLRVYVYSSKIGRSIKFYNGYQVKETGALLLIDGDIPNTKWWSDSQNIQDLEVAEGTVIRFMDSDKESASYIWDEIYIDGKLIDKKQCQCYIDAEYIVK